MADDKLVNFSYVEMQKNLRAENELRFVGEANRKSYVRLDASSLEDGFLREARDFSKYEGVKKFSYEVGREFCEALEEFDFGIDVVRGKIEFGISEDCLDSDVLIDAYRDVRHMKNKHSKVESFYINKGIYGVSSKVDCMYLSSCCEIKSLDISKKDFEIEKLVFDNNMKYKFFDKLFDIAFR